MKAVQLVIPGFHEHEVLNEQVSVEKVSELAEQWAQQCAELQMQVMRLQLENLVLSHHLETIRKRIV